MIGAARLGICSTLFTALTAIPPARGQDTPPTQPVQLQPVGRPTGDVAPVQGGLLNDRIDRLLGEWSQRSSKVRTLYAKFTRTTEDLAWGAKESANGSARFLHPSRARLDVEGENAESYVLNGKGEIWHYKPPLKQIKIYKLDPEKAKKDAMQDGPLPFLFGTKPEEAKARYRFSIMDENDKAVHIGIVPKFVEDQENFSRAEIWLNRETFLPDKLFFLEPNNNRVTFVFDGIWANIDIKETDFDTAKLNGWETIVQNLDQRPEAKTARAPRAQPKNR